MSCACVSVTVQAVEKGELKGAERDAQLQLLMDAGVLLGQNTRGSLIRSKARETENVTEFLRIINPVAPEVAENADGTELQQFNPLKPTLSSADLSDLDTAGTMTKLTVERMLAKIKKGQPQKGEVMQIAEALVKLGAHQENEKLGPTTQAALEELADVGGWFLALEDYTGRFSKHVQSMSEAKDGAAKLIKLAIKNTPFWAEAEASSRKSAVSLQTLGPDLQKIESALAGKSEGADKLCVSKLAVWLDSLPGVVTEKVLHNLVSFERERLEMVKGKMGDAEQKDTQLKELLQIMSVLDSVVELKPPMEDSFKTLLAEATAVKAQADRAQQEASAKKVVHGFVREDC